MVNENELKEAAIERAKTLVAVAEVIAEGLQSRCIPLDGVTALNWSAECIRHAQGDIDVKAAIR